MVSGDDFVAEDSDDHSPKTIPYWLFSSESTGLFKRGAGLLG